MRGEHDDRAGRGGPKPAVRDNAAAHRFEAEVDGKLATAAYRREGDVIVFTHTEVPPELEGHGLGSQLVHAVLAAAREQGLKVVPMCPFVARYMRDHPDTQDLLAPASRAAIEG